MQQTALTLQQILWRVENVFAEKEIVTWISDGETHRYTYGEFGDRVTQVAHALDELGIGQGSMVGTYGWNDYRHWELFYGTTCSGSTIHTINHQYRESYVEYVIEQAEDDVLFVAPELLDDVEAIADEIATETFVVLTDDESVAREADLPEVYTYESLVRDQPTSHDWPQIPEETPCQLLYTSGTTGRPKGVALTHRQIMLHAMSLGMSDLIGAREQDTIMSIVPIYHANGWGLIVLAPLVGADQVLPGADPDTETYLQLIDEEDVTLAGGAVTLFQDMLGYIRDGTYDVSSLNAIWPGGQAPPAALIETYTEEFGVENVYHSWGLTESLVSSFSYPKARMDESERLEATQKQGLPNPLAKFTVVQEGEEQPWDGESAGEVLLKTPWLASEYFENPAATDESYEDGWIRTGDIATIDADGYLDVVDRKKSVIKSGGEWISSIELENAIIDHDAVGEAAVIPAPDETWGERPLAVVNSADESLTEADLLTFLEETTDMPSWWNPDTVVFVDVIPKTSTGKYDKQTLKGEYANEA